MRVVAIFMVPTRVTEAEQIGACSGAGSEQADGAFTKVGVGDIGYDPTVREHAGMDTRHVGEQGLVATVAVACIAD